MLSKTQLAWRNADAVCFDVDSTVTQEEGIDELAKFCKKGDEVANLTKKAMGGNMTFYEALKLRLEIMKPSMDQIKNYLETHPPHFSPGIKQLVDILHERKVPVYLISGGFHSLIEPVALQLNIPIENVFANRIKFFFTGEYAGFDDTQPTSRNGGKGSVIRHLKDKYQYKNVVIIGDGATDMEACPPADAFIGYGGNVVRESVKSKAEWYVTDFQELINVLLIKE